MESESIKRLLEAVRDGSTDVDAALNSLASLPYEDLGFARLDHHRDLRRGFPEVIFCEGKTPEQAQGIFGAMAKRGGPVLATRVSPTHFKAIQDLTPEATYDPEARIAFYGEKREPANDKVIHVLCAGTSDLPVALEAALTAEILGNKVERLFDVGVAGLHRLLEHLEEIRKANVLIVIAGMEGALSSVVSGLVSRPVISVPTSVGYGTAFQGVTALLSMLNGCSPGVTVVNIDNGFGAAYAASLINREGK